MGRSIFSEEVSQRAGLARNAKYKIGGSKSKKCRMSTDGMTRRQWEKRNGTVNTYRLTQPMTWAEFKAYPLDLQKEYLSNLVETYAANLTTLSAMFGTSAMTLRSHIDDNNFGFEFKVGHRMTSEQRGLWEKFLNGGNNAEEAAQNDTTESEASIVHEAQSSATENDVAPMSMTQFAFTFQGKIDTAAIANSIRQLLGESGYGKVEVVCTL